MMNANNYLEHHGVLGMHWGHRNSINKSNNSNKGRVSEDFAKNARLRKKKVNQMSNAELESFNKRMQLETQYKNLNPNRIKKGLRFVKSLTAAGTTVASLYALSKTPLGQDIEKAIKNKR